MWVMNEFYSFLAHFHQHRFDGHSAHNKFHDHYYCYIPSYVCQVTYILCILYILGWLKFPSMKYDQNRQIYQITHLPWRYITWGKYPLCWATCCAFCFLSRSPVWFICILLYQLLLSFLLSQYSVTLDKRKVKKWTPVATLLRYMMGSLRLFGTLLPECKVNIYLWIRTMEIQLCNPVL